MSTGDIETAEVDLAVVRGIIEEAAKHLVEDKAKVLFGLLDSHVEVMRLLRQKGTTIVRLRRLFGLKKTERLETLIAKSGDAATTETTTELETDQGAGDTESNDASPLADEAASAGESDAVESGPCESAGDKPRKRKPRSSGRRSAADYKGPETFVPHAELCQGDGCPLCDVGKVYPFRNVICLVIRGQPPLAADKFRLEALRCNACLAVFNAEPPEEAKGPKYRPSSVAILAALHYAFGMPFYRQDKLQELLGVPVPASTQWKLMNESEPVVRPVYDALKRHAAKSHLFHIDDTYLQLLDAAGTDLPPSANGRAPPRTGQYTTGVLAVDRDGHRVALFVTGRQHAGENIVDLMKLRPPELHPPIIMSDALSRNTSKLFGLMMAYYAYCLAHARRGVVDQLDNFPDEAQHVLQELAKVFHVDKKARRLGLDGRQRKAFHNKHSRPVLVALKAWIRERFDNRHIEPNSDMGKALRYILRHWKQLTLFLRQPDAPLTNNDCERLLKVAIRYRKNSYFYKNARGAKVGDTFMALTYTAELNGKNPVHYITALLEHPNDVAADPDAWLPWTYETTLAEIATSTAPAERTAAAS